MVCVPGAITTELLETLAMPDERIAEPTCWPSLMKVTVPVGVRLCETPELTSAVKLYGCPALIAEADKRSAVALAPCVEPVTVTVATDDVEGA